MHRYYFFTLLLIQFIYEPINSQISFTESAQELTVRHFSKGNLVGAGVCVFDFNKDGLNDLALSTGYGFPIRFYVNKRDKFEVIDLGIDCICESKQVLWVDYDNDNDYDLFISCYGDYNRLYENEGDLTFQDVTIHSGLSLDQHKGYGACFSDFNRDGWLDLYYNSRKADDIFSDENSSFLYLNNADGTFRDFTETSGSADATKIPFASIAFDYNNDLWPDIFTAHDKLQFNTLLQNVGNAYFEDVSVETKADERMNAMCATFGDINRDGYQDIYITNTPIGNRLLLSSGQTSENISFHESANEYGVGFYGNGWGAQFFDADNDSDLDLYVSGSIVGSTSISSSLYEQNFTGVFEAPFIPSMSGDTVSSYSNAVGDLNGDSLLDIVVQNNEPYPFHIWMNTSSSDNGWLKLNLEGVVSNRDAIGTKIEVYESNRYQQYFTHCGYGFLGQNPHEVIIGLGQANQVDSLILSWSSGHIDKFINIQINQSLTIHEGMSTDGVIHISEDIAIVERISTSVFEVNPIEAIRFFPNPSMDLITIDASDETIKVIQILNASGAIVITSHQKNIDIKNLKEGIYFLKTIFTNGRYKSQVFCKIN